MLTNNRLLLAALLAGGSLTAQNSAVSSIRISTSPEGARFYVDGLPYVSGQVFLWPQGSKHIVQFPTDSVNGVSTGCQVTLDQQYKYCFSGWTDSTGTLAQGSAPDQTVTASPSITWLQASVALSYKIRIRFGSFPDAGSAGCSAPGNAVQDGARSGIVVVGGACFQSSGDVWGSGGITLNAFPYPGFVFAGWTINGQFFDSYLKTYTVNGPVTIGAGFELAKRVNFVTTPAGLQVLVDRTPTPTANTLSRDPLSPAYAPCQDSLTLPSMPPLTLPALCFGQFDFLPGSKHVIGAPSPQRDSTGKYWVFANFSNGLGPNSLYVASTDLGSADLITANFSPGVQAAFLTSPTGLKLSIDGRDNWQAYTFIWAANSSHSVIAPATQVDANGRTWTFQGWSNGGAASQTLALEANATALRMTAVYTSLGQLKVVTNPPGIKVQLNGTDCLTPCVLNNSTGTQVQVAAPASIPIDATSRMDFLGWGDSASPARSVTMTGDVQTIFANYGYSYLLTFGSDPASAADFQLSPPSADQFYPANAAVTVAAAARSGFRFRRWGGDLAGVYNLGQIVMSGPRSIVAQMDRIPYIAPAGIRNAAADTPDGSVAPGSIISIYGESLAPALESGPSSPLAQTIAEVVVTVGDRILPLFFVSPQQINAQVPSGLTDGDYTLTVRWTGKPDVTGTFTVSRNAPGLFASTTDTLPFVRALHEDGTVVTTASPARKGELLTIYGTGFGPFAQQIIDGFPFPTASPIALSDPVEVTAGGQPIVPEWSGGAPGSTGMTATKLRLPDGVASANVDLLVKVNGKPSNTVSLPVQ